MAAGEGLTPRQQERIEEVVESAREENGLDISVLLGDLEVEDLSQFRAACERLHAASASAVRARCSSSSLRVSAASRS